MSKRKKSVKPGPKPNPDTARGLLITIRVSEAEKELLQKEANRVADGNISALLRNTALPF